MFAIKYLERNQFVPRIKELPNPNLGIVIVIPCFREPELLLTLQSIINCRNPNSGVEVIILINHPEDAPESIKDKNRLARQHLDKWIQDNHVGGIKCYAAGPVELKKKWAGAGMARKAGMDEAVARYNLLGKPDGIIVSLDADTLVEENYLTEIENFFKTHAAYAGATISFSHQTENLEEKHLQGILLYEKYMNYYKRALGFTGYPFPMFTVGSAFAVTAIAYVKRGGMNRRQAGEDFYFLQNLVQVGLVGEIDTTVVHPSARLSNRVPFGTGPVLHRWMNDEEDLSMSYDFQSFIDLKQFFNQINLLFKIKKEDYLNLTHKLSVALEAFLKEVDFWNELCELNSNCSSAETFQRRFYQKFNAFKMLKYLNFSHNRYYSKADIGEQINRLNHYENKSPEH